jgi:adhesin/invasin
VAVQASPSTVTLQGQSTLTSSVTDPTGNPVSGVTVTFTLTDSTGGQLSAASATTNAQGQASVTYKASTISSAPNGVTVTVQVQGTAITSSTTLTVGGQTVFLSLGTGNQIAPYSTTQYSAPYTVQAVDAAGNGVSSVNVTFSVKSIAYAMGNHHWFTPPGVWQPIYSQTAVATNGFVGFCPATQVLEYNGVINPTPPPAGVTPVLTAIPGAVVSTDVGSVITGAGGTATVNLIYPKDHAYWVEAALTATATVSGTQNSTTANFVLLGLAADYTTQTVSPPGFVSPYGEGTACY